MVVEILVQFEVATDHAAIVAIWVGTSSIGGVIAAQPRPFKAADRMRGDN